MVNIKHTLVCIALTACPALAFAEQTVINLTQAGSLSSVITEDQKFSITDLKITGELNSNDILLIREMAGEDVWGSGTDGKLENLDISEAKIVSGGDAYFTLNGPVYTADNEVGDFMFHGVDALKNIKLPSSATKIGDYAFQECPNLETAELPAALTSIGREAFGSCNALKAIEFPNTLTSIGDGAFMYCSSLTTVTLPASVTEIGRNAFYPLNISLYLQSTVPPSPGAYMLGYDAKVYVPKGSIDAYRAAGWNAYDLYEYETTGISNITTEGENGKTTYYTLDGKKVDTPQKGIYIIKQEDGTTRKVIY